MSYNLCHTLNSAYAITFSTRLLNWLFRFIHWTQSVTKPNWMVSLQSMEKFGSNLDLMKDLKVIILSYPTFFVFVLIKNVTYSKKWYFLMITWYLRWSRSRWICPCRVPRRNWCCQSHMGRCWDWFIWNANLGTGIRFKTTSHYDWKERI